jgi:hypothetical protein
MFWVGFGIGVMIGAILGIMCIADWFRNLKYISNEKKME